MARLVLVGMPGVGKSSVAQALAALWGCGALDTDSIIASITSSSSAEILRSKGEVAFRECEADALDQALKSNDVVSTGGGIVTTPRARQQLKNQVTLWLDCEDAVIMPRLVGVDRPLLDDNSARSLTRLRAQREAWYRQVSRARVDATGTIDDVVKRVIDEVEKVAQ